MSDDFNTYITVFHNVLNAYTEATKNHIITLQDKYTALPITSRNPMDFSEITGIKITGANPILLNGLIIDPEIDVSECTARCIDNPGCIGALYTDGTDSNTCQLYSSIPLSSTTNATYTYDANSSFISYNHYLPTGSDGVTGATGTINARVMDALQSKLTNLKGGLDSTMGSSSQTSWNAAKQELQNVKDTLANAEEDKKINQDINMQLYNSGLNVVKTKTTYIILIVILLILLAIYVRDFNFSIFISILLFFIISIYGSIFLGAFLLLVIVLYLVYYAY